LRKEENKLSGKLHSCQPTQDVKTTLFGRRFLTYCV